MHKCFMFQLVMKLSCDFILVFMLNSNGILTVVCKCDFVFHLWFSMGYECKEYESVTIFTSITNMYYFFSYFSIFLFLQIQISQVTVCVLFGLKNK